MLNSFVSVSCNLRSHLFLLFGDILAKYDKEYEKTQDSKLTFAISIYPEYQRLPLEIEQVNSSCN